MISLCGSLCIVFKNDLFSIGLYDYERLLFSFANCNLNCAKQYHPQQIIQSVCSYEIHEEKT